MRRTLLAVVLAAAAALPRAAVAETQSEESAALGWQTEHADAVVVATVEDGASEVPGARAARVVVVESLRGRLGPGAEAVVTVPDDGHAAPWTAGARHLVFLREASGAAAAGPDEPVRCVPVGGAYGFRRLPETGEETRFPGIVREIAAALDDAGRVRDEDRLRTLLVGWMDDADAGVAWSAATDFVRHAELHDRLTEPERLRIVDAFRRRPVGKATKRALAFAVAATKHPSAAAALVDALASPRAAEVRSTLAEALRRLGDPAAQDLLALELASPEATVREGAADVLGVVGRAPAVPAARAALADQAEGVRTSAAHALGRIARNVREDDPAVRIRATPELLALLRAATSPREIQAAVWALAQLDDPDAFAALRKVAEDDPRAPARRFADAYLKQPRQELVFD